MTRDRALPGKSPGQPIYRLPRRLVLKAAWSAILGRPRSFAGDARAVVAAVHPSPYVAGAGNIPATGPFLLVCNHYSRPGLGNWWVPLTVSDAVAAARPAGTNREVRWVVTSEWRYSRGDWRRRVISPVTRWAFARLFPAYGFVLMPPMPPEPEDAARRAVAVRQAVRLARALALAGGILGLSPEGRDNPEGGNRLAEFPPGSGQFLALLAGAGLPIVPCGVSEPGGRLRLTFGPPFVPEIPAERSERDRLVAGQVAAALKREMSPPEATAGAGS